MFNTFSGVLCKIRCTMHDKQYITKRKVILILKRNNLTLVFKETVVAKASPLKSRLSPKTSGITIQSQVKVWKHF